MHFLPPPNFTEAKGVEWASFEKSAPHFTQPRKKPSGRRLLGRKYEALLQEKFLSEIPSYINSPWIKFSTGGAIRWCQPDGIIVDLARGIVVVVEVKLAHTPAAWWQVRKLYIPVLRKLFPQSLWQFRFLEVVKWYDCATAFPEPTQVLLSPEDASQLPHDTTGIFIWKT